MKAIQSSTVDLEDGNCKDKEESLQDTGAPKPSSDNTGTLVNALDKICSQSNTTTADTRQTPAVHASSDNTDCRVFRGNNVQSVPHSLQKEGLGFTKKTPATILRDKILFGETFVAAESEANFNHDSSVGLGNTPGYLGVQGESGLSSVDCPLAKMGQEGPIPITNYFSPQYSASVAKFLLRKKANIVLQVSLIDNIPSVRVKFSCNKNSLKKYQRRGRNRDTRESDSLHMPPVVDWVAAKPVTKRRKMRHMKDIDQDRHKQVDMGSDVPARLKRKVRGSDLISQEVHPKWEHGSCSAKTSETQQVGEEQSGEEVLVATNALEVQGGGWKLSVDEETTLLALSSGLRAGGFNHPSQDQ